MPTINVERTIDAPKDKVWEVMANFPGIANYSPGVVKSYTINGTASSGLGAERTCEFNADGSTNVQERIVRYEEGESFDVIIYDGTLPMPVNNMVATFSLHPVNNKQTTLRATVNYELKSNPMYWLMGKFMFPRFGKKTFESVLDGAKYHIETGNTVTNAKTLHQALASV